MATKMVRPEDHARLEEMGKTWDRLAHSREGKLLAGIEPDDI
jgi:hypothetical protein